MLKACPRRLNLFGIGFHIRVVRIDQKGDRRRMRQDFMQQLHALCPEFCGNLGHPCDVALRPVEARDETGFDWIIANKEDNGDCCGRSLR